MDPVSPANLAPTLHGADFLRIVLVEDNEGLAKGITYRLEDLGHSVDTLSDGLHADDHLRADGGDIVILDINLPGLDRLSILKHMRDRGDHRPVILLTARSGTRERVRGLDSGADDYLVKPFDMAELEARIRALARRKPREIRDYLDRYVIQQTEAKKVLSVAICDHYNHVRRCIEDPALRDREYAKQNIILLGPTGVGKTYLMRCIARLIGVPFVKADATKFSETGYVGHDVEDIVRDLVRIADGNTDLAQYGIIYIDEIDKIANSVSGTTKDVSGRGVGMDVVASTLQRMLLDIAEIGNDVAWLPMRAAGVSLVIRDVTMSGA